MKNELINSSKHVKDILNVYENGEICLQEAINLLLSSTIKVNTEDLKEILSEEFFLRFKATVLKEVVDLNH